MAKKEKETSGDALKDLFIKKYGNKVLVDEIISDFISTNNLRLDYATGAGFKKGRYYQFYGKPSSGKTAVALHLAGVVQKSGGKVLWFDSEQSYESKYSLDTFGFNYQAPNTYFSQRMQAAEIFHMIEDAIEYTDLIVIDSTDALISPQEESGIIGDANVGGISKISAAFFRKILQKLNDSQCILIAISHEKVKLEMSGYSSGGSYTTGGGAWDFYASARLRISRKEQIKVGDNVIGQVCKVQLVKNKVATPFRTVDLILRYGEGFDTEAELVDISKEMGFIHQAGAWHTFDKDIFPERSELKFQGQEKVLAYLRQDENKEFVNKLTERIKAAMRGDEI